MKVLTLLVCVFWCAFSADGRRWLGSISFQVGSYGAKADGKTDDSAVRSIFFSFLELIDVHETFAELLFIY